MFHLPENINSIYISLHTTYVRTENERKNDRIQRQSINKTKNKCANLLVYFEQSEIVNK